MRALLDVNVLVALLDRQHVAHDRAHAWLAQNLCTGWAFSGSGLLFAARALKAFSWCGCAMRRSAIPSSVCIGFGPVKTVRAGAFF